MNNKLFKKLNESLMTPVKKDSIIISEEDEKRFIFGPKNNFLSEILTEDDYTFNRDEYIAYINAAEKKQEAFDRRRMNNRQYLSKDEWKSLKKEEKKAKKENEKNQSKEIEELKRKIKDDDEISTNEKNKLMDKIEELNDEIQKLKRMIPDTSTSAGRRVATEVYKKEHELLSKINIPAHEMQNTIQTMNRQPEYSSVPNAIKQQAMDTAFSSSNSVYYVGR